uniref:hypothetical protein n=1 Tax=Streptosporangium sp. CA-235898 TaxID=3240073 RepID=UPI003F499105
MDAAAAAAAELKATELTVVPDQTAVEPASTAGDLALVPEVPEPKADEDEAGTGPDLPETPEKEQEPSEGSKPEPEPEPAKTTPTPRPAPAKAAAKPRAERRAKVTPTSNADCKGDARRKHTINVAPDVRRRLLNLQLAETMAAGKERPLWPHVDAALAPLRAGELAAGDLAKWGERAEAYADLSGDDYQQLGTLLRGSVLAAVRTLRVRLRAAGVEGVDVQAVLSTAVTAYLDALVAQGDLIEADQE